jgi:hypothetical protein
MAMNPLPPQAYTKDSLLKAYSWLQNQESSIKEMATTPDILVSLFLKATRDGDSVLERPSIQNFKHELKQLAGMMGEFDKEVIEEKIQNQNLQKQNIFNDKLKSASLESDKLGGNTLGGDKLAGLSTNFDFTLPLNGNSLDSRSLENRPIENRSQESNSAENNPEKLSKTHHEVLKKGDCSLLENLDAKSLMLISEVKTQLNLSSDLESLKLLIQAGYNKTKKLF